MMGELQKNNSQKKPEKHGSILKKVDEETWNELVKFAEIIKETKPLKKSDNLKAIRLLLNPFEESTRSPDYLEELLSLLKGDLTASK